MHEARLMHDLMSRIAAIATAEGGGRITRVTVWLGALSHFTPEHFAAHFEDASRGTLAEGAATICEASEDITHPDARDVRVLSVEVR